MRRFILSALAACLCFAGSATAADIIVKETDTSDWPTVRVMVEARDAASAQTDYTLIVDDQRLTPTSVRAIESSAQGPASMVVALDTSRSLSPAHLEAAKKALAKFAGQVDRSEQIGLVSFNDKVELVTSLTRDRDQFRNTLSRLKLGGQNTTLYRAMMFGIDMLKDVPGERMLLVVTDGKDEGSAVSLDQVLQAARDNNVRVSVIGLPGLPGNDTAKYLPNAERVVSTTRGEFRKAATAAELESATYDLMVDNPVALSRMYELTFTMPETLRAERVMERDGRLIRRINGMDETGTLTLWVPAAIAAATVPATGDAVRVTSADDTVVRTDAVNAEPVVERSFFARYWPLLLLLLLLLLWLLMRKKKPVATAPAARVAADDGALLLINFPLLDLSFPLRPGTMVMGSGVDADIRVGNVSIDEAHVEFCSGEECFLRRIPGSRGVLLNGKPVEEPTPLKPGDELLIGDVRAVIKRA